MKATGQKVKKDGLVTASSGGASMTRVNLTIPASAARRIRRECLRRGLRISRLVLSAFEHYAKTVPVATPPPKRAA
jgi:hypothetical protein